MKPSDMVRTVLAADLGVDYRLDWAGGLAWLRLPEGISEADVIATHTRVQDICQTQTSGHATLFKASDAVLAQVPAFQPEAPGVKALAAGLRAKFDPGGILNAGVMGA